MKGSLSHSAGNAAVLERAAGSGRRSGNLNRSGRKRFRRKAAAGVGRQAAMSGYALCW